MCIGSNLKRRGAVYYVRVTVPAELQRARSAAGQSAANEVWRSTGAKDLNQAKRCRDGLLTRIRDEWDAELTAYQAGEVPERAIRVAMRKPERVELDAAVWREIPRLQQSYKGRLRFLRTIPDAMRNAKPTDYADPATDIIQRNSWNLPPGSPDFAYLCRQLKGAHVLAIRAAEAHHEGDYLSPVANPAPPPDLAAKAAAAATPAKSAKTPKAKPGEALLGLYERYHAEQGRHRSPEDQRNKRNIITAFAQHVGEGRDVRTITREDVREFKQALDHWPSGALKLNRYEGKTFPQIVALAQRESPHPEMVGAKTVNNYLAAIGAVFGWLYANGYSSEPNITAGLAMHVDKRKAKRTSYTDPQLKTIFGQPLFAGDGTDDWQFWIPAICLYSGARLGEIAQMRTEDVRKIAGHWCLCITDEGEGQRTKNETSNRNIPIHPELVRLGLLKYHQRMTKAGEERLWPELKADIDGRYSRGVSAWWRGYVADAGVVARGATHMLRHTFITGMRRAGVSREEAEALTGHANDRAYDLYGEMPPEVATHRAKIIKRLAYPVKMKAKG